MRGDPLRDRCIGKRTKRLIYEKFIMKTKMDSSIVLKQCFIASTVMLFFVGFYVTQYSSLAVQSNGLIRSESIPHVRGIPTYEIHDVKVRPNTTIPPQDGVGSIDLDVSLPSVDEMYDRLVLIAAFSDNHYKEAMGYIGTAQKHMPGKRIIVYDLGLSNALQQKVRQLCDVELRRFPFNNYPDHVRKLHSFAWKPIIINLSLNEFGAIYYGDASIRFKNSLKVLLPGIERHHGYMTNILHFDPTKAHHYKLTVPAMFTKLGIDREEYHNCNNSAPHIQPGTQLIINSTTIQTKLMQPWLQCALEKECITPKGSSRANHRQDASAITLLVYKNLFGEWTVEDNDTKKMQAVLDVKRGSNGLKSNPRNC
ncbi:uncharacterized protein [Apostichopus japonicus]|uniref:uncharacterized protein isoform X2 n=1 Tax=Stichopus japonicus TaxID=307972 RepID=UPI003AB1BA9C